MILTKVIMGMKYGIKKERKPQNIIEYLAIYLVSIFLILFPVIYNGDNLNLMRLKKKINVVTYVIYGLVVILGIVIFIQIYQIRNV
jgi:hypothetical protein